LLASIVVHAQGFITNTAATCRHCRLGIRGGYQSVVQCALSQDGVGDPALSFPEATPREWSLFAWALRHDAKCNWLRWARFGAPNTEGSIQIQVIWDRRLEYNPYGVQWIDFWGAVQARGIMSVTGHSELAEGAVLLGTGTWIYAAIRFGRWRIAEVRRLEAVELRERLDQQAQEAEASGTEGQ